MGQEDTATNAVEEPTTQVESLPLRNGTSSDHTSEEANDASTQPDADTTARLDAIESERNNLREQVTELRKSLQTLQDRHSDELKDVRGQLDNANTAKDGAEEQYRSLLGKVGTIRSQLGERLKADAV